MINVTFVCLGNICRSPMAELIFKNMVKERGLELSFVITSCGTSDCEEGNPIYEPARRTLAAHGISGSHVARQLTLRDIKNNDYILVMDSSNLMDVLRLTCGGYGEKIFKLCSFTARPRDVADPWYTDDFETTWRDVLAGCEGLLRAVTEERL